MLLFEKDKGYSTDLEISKGTITRNKQTNVVTTLSNKYPVVINNGNSDYESGQFTMMFLPKDSTGEYTAEKATNIVRRSRRS